jgi:hypothetical protein
MLYIFCGIGKQFLISSGSIFWISLQMLLWSRLNRKPATEYMLYKDEDNKLEALEIYL